MSIGEKIRELRVEHELLQRELAAKIHIASNTLSQFECGKANPSLEVLSALADVLEVSTDYLLGREDDFGQVTIYQQTDGIESLTSAEQKIIDALRRNAPSNAGDFLAMYTELPSYMQESIFAELKGMHLGYKVSKNKNYKEN